MFKETPEGKTQYCLACEIKAQGDKVIGEAYRHTCQPTPSSTEAMLQPQKFTLEEQKERDRQIQPQPDMKEWEEEFERRWMNHEATYLNLGVGKEIKSFIKQLLSSSKEKWVEEVREKIEKNKKSVNLALGSDGILRAFPKSQAEYNFVIDDILQFLPSHEDK